MMDIRFLFEAMIAMIFFLILCMTWGRNSLDRLHPFMIAVLGMSLAVYITAIIHYTILWRTVTDTMTYELSLFWSYRFTWNESSLQMWKEIVYNILLFVPMGILFPIMFLNCRKVWRMILTAAGVSVLIESIQLIFHIGLFEFDDMLHNTLGAVMGYLVYKVLDEIWHREKEFMIHIGIYCCMILIVILYYMLLWVKASNW